MAILLKSSLTRNLFFLLSYTAAIVAASRVQLPYKSSQQNALSHYPQPQDFPSARLYQAYYVIQRFKNTITCDPLNITSTWTGPDICGNKTYVGFYCTTLPGHGLTITSAVLDSFGLCAPKLEGFIDQLPDLALFQSSSNKFDAFNAPNFAGLSYLYNLDIDDRNTFQSSAIDLPTKDLANFNLCVLYGIFCGGLKVGKVSLVARTADKGAIPSVTNARALLLNNDNISGQLPADLGFSKFSYLALANNKLTGSIPPSISNLQGSLLEMLLLNNQLSGCLPYEVGMLTKANVIDAGMNQLTGPIPSSFSCLTSVEQLNLGSNRLYGEIPAALCNPAAGPASRLANLTLSSNYLTSVGPSCLPLIKDGVVNVKNNCIPGFANQRRSAECASFLSQPKTCPEASANHVACPAAAANIAAAPAERVANEYSSYVTYATLHD
uniref:Leucine-rich repeat-containing N-terminal plant-type domain-containing protein n=1 Tax=Oryza brachyantha TaxID=4533 RepID=J3LET1_ORYBR